jgi:hypothetical protein
VRPTLIRFFMSFPKKLEVLQTTRNLIKTHITTQDYVMMTDRHGQLIPYLKHARNHGNITSLQKNISYW